MQKTNKTTFDVIILGSGGAGCSAALEAIAEVENVLLLTRDRFLNSKTARAQGGIQTAISVHDSIEHHFQDTMKAGEYANSEELVRVLTEKSASVVTWLENLGVKFDQKDGTYKLQNAAGLSFPRILSCGDESGNLLMKPLMQAVQQSNVLVSEYAAVYKLHKNNEIYTVDVQDTQTGEKFSYSGYSVIIAAGGAIPAEKKAGMSLPGGDKVPDSLQLAEHLGAKVINPDLVQYHPTGIIQPAKLRRKPVPEVMRAAGANLLNSNLELFTDPMLTRKKLCDAIIKECEEGRCVETEDGHKGVWLDTPAIDKLKGSGYTSKNFSKLYNNMLEHGHDITQSPILVFPIAHYSLGGIQIDQHTSTNIKGLFAAGESTWGVHGKDRLMGNSLLEIFVFGRIAGQEAARLANQIRESNL